MRFTFVLNFFKALFEHAIKLLSVKLSFKIHIIGHVIVLVIMQTKSFYLLFDF